MKGMRRAVIDIAPINQAARRRADGLVQPIDERATKPGSGGFL
jgi:hypothetical protein